MIEDRVPFPPGFLEAFCERNHIAKLSLFGSVLREDFQPESDIDMLVEFDPRRIPSLLRIVGMEQELSGVLGRTVEITLPEEFRPTALERVMAEAKKQYETRGYRPPATYSGARA